jgi:hypothetical protein
MRFRNKTTLFALALLLLPGLPLHAADATPGRLRVAPESGEQADLKACLNTAAEAACAEDLEGFLDCFAGSTKRKLRKETAIRFVRHEVSMEVLDTQVLRLAGNSGQAAVRYRLNLSADQYDVVSLVAMKREQGYWKIHSEKIKTVEHQSSSLCSPSRYACLGGTCRIQ